MGLPLSTTTITVLRPAPADLFAEPYAGTNVSGLTEVVTGVRAVIDIPVARDAGREVAQGGEQTVTEFRFSCDPCDVANQDYIRDDTTNAVYRVVWHFDFAGHHIEGGLRVVEGLV